MKLRINKILRCLGIVTMLTLSVISTINAQVSQTAQKATPTTGNILLSIDGEVEHSLKLTTADLSKLPRKTVQAKEHDGKEVTFEGAELREVLKLAGVKFGEQMRGKSLALFLVVDAADKYRAVFALPELDPAFTDNVILLADKRDGKPLADSEGPLRIVAPNEKRPARWVRQVNSLTIRRAQ